MTALRCLRHIGGLAGWTFLLSTPVLWVVSVWWAFHSGRYLLTLGVFVAGPVLVSIVANPERGTKIAVVVWAVALLTASCLNWTTLLVWLLAVPAGIVAVITAAAFISSHRFRRQHGTVDH